MFLPAELYLGIFIIGWLFYLSNENLQGWNGTSVPSGIANHGSYAYDA